MAAILVGAFFRKTHWHELSRSLKGSLFLVSLVWCASLMSVESLPPASVVSVLALGFLSAVFDNIPLTRMVLEQGGYDWGLWLMPSGMAGR